MDLSGGTRIAEAEPRAEAVLSELAWPGLAVALTLIFAARYIPVWVTVVLVVCAAAWSMWAVVGDWRIELNLGSDGVTVRNQVRAHRIGWHEISRFTDGSDAATHSNYRPGSLSRQSAAAQGAAHAYLQASSDDADKCRLDLEVWSALQGSLATSPERRFPRA
jgi:hypothetical protein